MTFAEGRRADFYLNRVKWQCGAGDFCSGTAVENDLNSEHRVGTGVAARDQGWVGLVDGKFLKRKHQG